MLTELLIILFLREDRSCMLQMNDRKIQRFANLKSEKFGLYVFYPYICGKIIQS